jgi:hydrogenase nickel incorporation protein HypA/HybF
MHEMGIVSSVLAAVEKETAKYPGSRPTKVGLRIGEWSGVDLESVRFCFEALTAGTDLAPLQLELAHPLQSDQLDIAFIEMEDHL